ncbi:MAG TPA: hypothetical protein VM575_15915 [Nocardioides sp.]|nr:hypothetical protein [Nocardioides sp.]
MSAAQPLTELGPDTPGLRMFPPPTDVFVEDQQWLAEHLHPLVSIDLSLVDPALAGWIHLFSPIEPDEVTIGWRTADAAAPADPTGMLRENWLSFRVEGDRMRFLGDERFFALSYDVASAPMEPHDFDRLVAHRDEQRRSWDATRRWYDEHGTLVRLDDSGAPAYGSVEPVHVLDQVGGVAAAGNWAFDDFPMEFTDDEEGAFPVSPDGRPFRFVAEVPGWHYRTAGADGILLFYEPVEQLALLTFDWT